MTTKVTVEACCADDTEVLISVADSAAGVETVIQSGETHEEYVYDERMVTVRERPKTKDVA